MQEILNKMVTSVRYGVLKAEDASRTIHESAALLELPLAEELPMTTVLVSGMRKTATAEDMVKAMREFGDIDVAAVASGRRGFGVVRFRRLKSVERALRRYQSGEIVIQDVAVQVKVLKPNDDMDVRG
jgi:ferric-dicitrate binding protein FerR (iron transport regulator)